MEPMAGAPFKFAPPSQKRFGMRIFMEIIRFESVLKPSGDEYRKVCMWNRFVRTKKEAVLSCLPGLLSIVLLCMGYRDPFFIIVYAVLLVYPFFIYNQFKGEISYRLKHREPTESAPCVFTFMPNGILAEIHDYNFITQYRWDEFTTIYDKMGYYMMYNKNQMVVMIKKADIPEHLRDAALQYISDNIDRNKCVIKK